MNYVAPLEDIRFVMSNLLDLDELAAHGRFSMADTDTVMGLLAESGRFNAEVVAPTNRVGDMEGSHLQPDGSVVTPKGFKEAYQQFVEAGWNGIQFNPEYGGGGFPWLVGLANQELIVSSNMAFSLCPMLTQGAIEALQSHGSDEQKSIFLTHMISGRWSGTMNLTEPQAGSDVGAITTKASPRSDGWWNITGTKIFITWGEHDMAKNIIHFVLARTPGAPPGTKGVSLFLVPKFRINADGTLGERNDVVCASLEHKMGIKASPTAVLNFGETGEAVGSLIGEENRGMRYMFTMMNNARLTVGLQGLAVSERAYQQAKQYATERLQGQAFDAEPGRSSPIVEHADVRRMLMTMKASIEAMRAVLYLNAASIDRSVISEDPRHNELVQILTPISKAWATDLGMEVTSTAIQVYGGMGFVEETGVAQHFRDLRISPIYEGTNGIQAVDLVGRKISLRNGEAIRDLITDIRKTASAAVDDLASMGAALHAAADDLETATRWMLAQDMGDRLAGATSYLALLGYIVGGWLMVRSAIVASGGPDSDFSKAKVSTARFYTEQLLPRVHGLLGPSMCDASSVFAVTTDQL